MPGRAVARCGVLARRKPLRDMGNSGPVGKPVVHLKPRLVDKDPRHGELVGGSVQRWAPQSGRLAHDDPSIGLVRLGVAGLDVEHVAGVGPCANRDGHLTGRLPSTPIERGPRIQPVGVARDQLGAEGDVESVGGVVTGAGDGDLLYLTRWELRSPERSRFLRCRWRSMNASSRVRVLAGRPWLAR